MKALIGGLIAASTLVGFAYGQTTVPKAGLVITRSTKLKAGQYLIPSKSDDNGPGVIVIRGNNIVVDFAGTLIRGTSALTDPDERKGVGIQIEGKNITIKNATIRGYKVAMIARKVAGLKILDSDLSYNWKAHLLSNLEREDGADWMSYHHNEADEWLRYGAAIYLRGCTGFEVRGCKVTGGQCGLMLTQCTNGLAWNNDFSFNSGLGIGMYRSSNNRIMHNKADWDVRGFSYGVYNRGQDSAGILVFEQCNNNVFAYNSATHGGDGYFLWAGQHTMDTGKGGCNDNLLYGNDFSHSPANGIEATFSRNTFANNLLLECWHGIWGGYSYDTKTVGNVFGYNDEGFATEQGQNNPIQGNIFFRDSSAIHLWAKEKEDPTFAYAKGRDVTSHGYKISDNVFSQIAKGPVLRAAATSSLQFGPNKFGPINSLFDISGPLKSFSLSAGKVGTAPTAPSWKAQVVPTLGTGWQGDAQGHLTATGATKGLLPAVAALAAGQSGTSIQEYRDRFLTNWNPLARPTMISVGTLPQGKYLGVTPPSVLAMAPKPLVGGMNPFLAKDVLRGWRYILVDEWGPYDFRRPLLWPRGDVVNGDSTVKQFEILGPKGQWRLLESEGVRRVSAVSGTVPGIISLDFDPGEAGLTTIEMEYIGGPTVDYRGITTPAGKPVKFSYTKFHAPIDWTVNFYSWSKSVDPSDPHSAPDPDAFKAAISGTPIVTKKTDELDYAGYSFVPETPNNHFATVADGTFSVPKGEYSLDVTTDDGIRVWLDGKLVIDEFHYQGPTPYSAKVTLGGEHKIHVEHFQIDGYASLKVTLKPR